MHTKGLVNGWYIIVGLDLKGNVKSKELLNSTLDDIEVQIDQLNQSQQSLTYFGYKIKDAELL